MTPPAARGRPFPKGISGNPGGRRKGTANALPRVRALVNEVHTENLTAIKAALARVATSSRTALAMGGWAERVAGYEREAIRDRTLRQEAEGRS